MAQMARRGNHALWCSGGTGSGGGITAPLPPAAFDGARPGGPRLLVNRIAVAQRGRHPPRIARQGPSRPPRIGNARPHTEPQRRAILLHLHQQGRLAAKQMRATGQVNHQRRRLLFRHPRAELARPAPQHRQKRRLGQGIGRLGQKPRTHGRGIAQRLAQPQPHSQPFAVKRGDHLRPALITHHRKGQRQHIMAQAQSPLCSQTGKPKGQDSAV